MRFKIRVASLCNVNSIEDVKSENKTNIFPNPIADVLNAEFEEYGEYKLKIVNTSGKIVYTSNQQDTKNVRLNLSEIPSGVYMLVTEDLNAQKSWSKIIVKQ